jgi:apolipoprotein N-acyltransferase
MTEVLFLIISAFIFAIAFPSFINIHGFWIFAFVGLIPMFAVIHNTKWYLTPIYGFLYGFVFYLIFNYWLKAFHPLAILIVPIIKGGELLIAFPLFKLIDSAFKKRGYIINAILYVAYTYVSQNWFAGYPYGIIGYAPYKFIPFIQIASITGVWGINFVMVLPQILFGIYLGDFILNKAKPFKSFIKEYFIDLIIYVALFVAILIFGFVSMHKWDNTEPQDYWRVASVQHSSDTWEGGYLTYKRNFNNLRLYSLESLRENPDIVIWSETAFVPSVAWHEKYPSDEETSKLVDEFVNFGYELNVPLLTGNPEGVIDDVTKPAILDNGEWNRKDYNTVIYFSNGKIQNTYRKQHLVPFTEHFPYQKQMPHLYALLEANDYHWWEKGDDPVVFTADRGITFSTPICFEDVFGEISADFVKNGANVLVNMTNDGWADSVTSEMQHAAIGVFRSIENRKSTIRSTNSGITCRIDTVGRMIDPMEPFHPGWKIYEVPVYTTEANGSTFFTLHPNLFAQISVYISLVLLIFGIALLIKNRGKNE